MNNLYSQETYFKLKKDYKKWLIISILLFIIGLSLLFLSAFIINHKNVLYIKIIDIVLVNIILLVAVYFFIELFVKKRIRSQFLYRLLTMERFSGKIRITEIKKPYLVRKHIRAYEVVAKDENDKEMICYLEEAAPLSLNVNDEVEVILAHNFIVDVLGEK